MSDTALLSVQRLELPLEPPLVNARGEWRRRCSLVARLRDPSGHYGQGEAAPLPNFSRDSLADCERALDSIPITRLAALEGLSTPHVLLAAAAELVPEEVPAARFALETALLDRLGHRSGQPLWQLIAQLLPPSGDRPGKAPVELCALLPSDDPGAAISEARRREQAGVLTFKLKIGPDRVRERQLATLGALRSVLGTRCKLRLDANGSLSSEALPLTLRQLAAFQPEFVEEPLAVMDLAAYAASPCPLALDESLQALDVAGVEAFLKLPTARALVLKPTALGGIQRCLMLAHQSQRHAREVVVSHTLEGPLGWAACAHLALALQSTSAAGLWPLSHQRGAGPSIIDGHLIADAGAGLGVGP